MQRNLLIVIIGVLLALGVGFFALPALVGGNRGADSAAQEGAFVADPTADAAKSTSAVTAGSERTSVAAQGGAGDSGTVAQRATVALRGRVVDARQQPVANATVRVETGMFQPGPASATRSAPPKPVLTGGDGRFEVMVAAADRLTVTLAVSHAATAPLVVDKGFEPARADLDAGDLALLSGGAILGAVTDLDGNSVLGAVASLRPAGGNRVQFSRYRLELLPKIEVDARGGFLVENVMPGEYRIEATAPRKTIVFSDVVNVQDGRREQLEPLRLGPGNALTGLVLAADDQPIAGAEVSVQGGKRNWDEQRAETDKKGQFAFDHLAAGTVIVRAQAKGYQSSSQQGVQLGVSPALVFRLLDGLKISGVVRDAQSGAAVTRYAVRARRVGGIDDGQAQQNLADYQRELARSAERAMVEAMKGGDHAGQFRTRIDVSNQKGGMRFEFQPPDQFGGRRYGNPGSGEPKAEVEEHPEGAFAIVGLDEGIYVVEVDSPEHVKASSQRLTLRSGVTTPPLAIVLARGFDVVGRTTSSSDGAPLAGAIVELVAAAPKGVNGPQKAAPGVTREMAMGPRLAPPGMGRAGPGQDGSAVLSTTSDAQGKFTLRHAPAGNYKLVARADAHAPKASPEFELAADLSDVQLALGSLATLSGRVLDTPKGKEGLVSVIALGSSGTQKTTKAKDDGSYEIDDLVPGGYTVRAFTGDAATFLRLEGGGMRRGPDRSKPDVVLEEGEHKTLDLKVTLHPVGTVTGLVLKNGLPVAGLSVVLRRLDGDKPQRNDMDYVMASVPGGAPVITSVGRLPPATTDQRGEFTMPEVPEGRYELRVSRGLEAGVGGMGGAFFARASGSDADFYRQEIWVRAENTTRVNAGFQTGFVKGRVLEEGGAQVALSGSITLYQGTTTVPADIGAFEKSNAVIWLQARASSFQSREILAGEYLLVLQVPGREVIQKSISVPVGDSLAVDLEVKKAGQAPPRR